MGDAEKRTPSSKMRPNQLMQSLLKGTARLQKILSDNLDELESCTSVVRSRFLAWTILDLYEKGSHLSAVIDVLGKLNDELVFCRRKVYRVKDGKKRPSASNFTQRMRKLEKSIAGIIENNIPENWENFLEPPQDAQSQSRPDSKSLSKRLQKSPTKIVTLLTPPVTASSTQGGDGFASYGDKSDAYWTSGHHQFMHFPDKDWYAVIQENNLSYQNLHLVAPDNFVTPTTVEYISSTALPWLTKQDVSLQNFDILREDLERVLRRTRKLQDKVWQAANLSVKFADSWSKDQKERRKISQSWHSRDSFRGYSSARSDLTGLSTVRNSSLKSASINLGGGQPWTQKVIERERLTRVNIFDKFPRTSAKWTGAMPDPHGYLTQRDVSDQGNLLQQTKLTLFVPQREKKKAVVKRDLITPDSIFSSQSFRGNRSSMRLVNKLLSRGGDSGLARLRKNRIDDLIQDGLTSSIATNRADAAVSLFQLGGFDAVSAIPALIQTVSEDPDSVVKFQASKALLNLGTWPSCAISEFTYQLRTGNTEVQIDVLEAISSAPNAKDLFLDSEDMEIQRELVEELRKNAMLSENDSERAAYLAAACLVDLCDPDDVESSEIAHGTLKHVALFSEDQDIRAESLEVLVRNLNACDDVLFSAMLSNLNTAVKWRHRLSAALLLGYLGPDRVEKLIDEDVIYEILQHKVWDDVKREVRLGVSQAVTSLGFRPRLLEDLDRFLRDPSEELRTRAVVSMSAVGIHSDATLRFLVEMLDLDASDYVRLQILRTFSDLGLTDVRAVRAAKERERAGGPLATAALKYLSQLGDHIVTTPKSPRRRKPISAKSKTLSPPQIIPPVAMPMKKRINRDISSSRAQKQRLNITSTAVRKSAKLAPGNRMNSAVSSTGILIL